MCVNKSVCQIALIITLAIPLIWGGFRFTGLDCRAVDPTFCAFVNCTIKPIKRGVKEINGAVRLLKVPVDNITVKTLTIYPALCTTNIFHLCRFAPRSFDAATVNTPCTVSISMVVNFGLPNGGTLWPLQCTAC